MRSFVISLFQCALYLNCCIAFKSENKHSINLCLCLFSALDELEVIVLVNQDVQPSQKKNCRKHR